MVENENLQNHPIFPVRNLSLLTFMIKLKAEKTRGEKMITLNLHQAMASLFAATAKVTWCPKINRVFLRPIPSFFVRHYRLSFLKLVETS